MRVKCAILKLDAERICAAVDALLGEITLTLGPIAPRHARHGEEAKKDKTLHHASHFFGRLTVASGASIDPACWSA